MMLWWLVIVVIVVWAVYASGPSGAGGDGATRILEERFARGEIDAEELRAGRLAIDNGRR